MHEKTAAVLCASLKYRFADITDVSLSASLHVFLVCWEIGSGLRIILFQAQYTPAAGQYYM